MQAVEKMEASGMEDYGAQTFCQNTWRTSLGSFHYRRVLRGDEVVKHLVLKELELTARRDTGVESGTQESDAI